MDPLRPRNILDGIADAQAIWTYHRDQLIGSDRLSHLAVHTDRLVRALSRLQVLSVTHPDLTLDDAIPRGAIPIDEVEQWIEDTEFLRSLVESPPIPTTIDVVLEVPTRATEELAEVLASLNIRRAQVQMHPDADGVPVGRIDLSARAAEAVDALNDDEETAARIADGTWEVDEEEQEVVSDSIVALRKRLMGGRN